MLSQPKGGVKRAGGVASPGESGRTGGGGTTGGPPGGRVLPGAMLTRHSIISVAAQGL